MVELKIDARQLAYAKKALADIADGVPKVLTPAINRALAKGRTTARREIRKVYTIKSKDIPIAVHKATRAKTSGDVKIQDTMLSLDKFYVRPRGMQHGKRRRPIFAQVKKGGGGIIQNAFYIPQGGPYSRIGPSRYPIFKLATIGAAIMASQPEVVAKINKDMGDTLAKRIDHEVNRVLESAGKNL